MTDNNTRCYPRSLSQAFADERAQWLEGPERTSYGDKAVCVTLLIAAVVVLFVLGGVL